MIDHHTANVISVLRSITPELDHAAPCDRGREAWFALAAQGLLPEAWADAAPLRFAYSTSISSARSDLGPIDPVEAGVVRDWPLLPGAVARIAGDIERIARAVQLAREFSVRITPFGAKIGPSLLLLEAAPPIFDEMVLSPRERPPSLEAVSLSLVGSCAGRVGTFSSSTDLSPVKQIERDSDLWSKASELGLKIAPVSGGQRLPLAIAAKDFLRGKRGMTWSSFANAAAPLLDLWRLGFLPVDFAPQGIVVACESLRPTVGGDSWVVSTFSSVKFLSRSGMTNHFGWFIRERVTGHSDGVVYPSAETAAEAAWRTTPPRPQRPQGAPRG